MYQGTTPAIVYTIAGMDVSAMTPFVSFKNGTNLLTKTGTDVTMEYDSGADVTTVICFLTQAETLEMQKGNAETQIRFIDSGNQAYATNKEKVRVDDVIYKAIISYEGE